MPYFAGPSLARKTSPAVDEFFRQFDPRIPFARRLDPEPSVLDFPPAPDPPERLTVFEADASPVPLPAPSLPVRDLSPVALELEQIRRQLQEAGSPALVPPAEGSGLAGLPRRVRPRQARGVMAQPLTAPAWAFRRTAPSTSPFAKREI